MSRPLQKFVERLSYRSELTKESRKALLAIDADLVPRGARWDIVRAGYEVSVACLVESGIVGRSEQFADGTRRTAAYYVAGDMCDLHSMPVPVAGWYITALTDCRIYEVPHAALQDAFMRYPDIAFAFWRDTVADASILAKWVTVLSGAPAKQRVAHLLCEFGVRIGAVGLGSRRSFPFPLTQVQISELIGATPVHTSRVIQELAREGLIVQRRGSIEICDLDALERVAEFDPEYLLLEAFGRGASAPRQARQSS